jgi:hypothetical protein
MLRRITEGWINRAKVRREPVELEFEPELPDFLETLLPFHQHPTFQSLSSEDRQKILSSGWLIYNEKTVAIETAIVSPSCQDALEGRIPGLGDGMLRQVICETLVDEAYHLLLVENANRLTRFHRGLGQIRVPSFNLVRFMEAEKARCSEGWQRILVQLATSVVSEIFVSDYLHQLSDCRDIQPMNRATVAAHRHDELAHSKIFTLLSEAFYPALSPAEQAFFAEVLPKPIAWFADMELDIWESVLEQLRVPGGARMIADCRPLNANAAQRVDYSGVTELARNLGVFETAQGQDCFLALGIAA